MKKLRIWFRDHWAYGWGAAVVLLIAIALLPAKTIETTRTVYIRGTALRVRAAEARLRTAMPPIPTATQFIESDCEDYMELAGSNIEIEYVSVAQVESSSSTLPPRPVSLLIGGGASWVSGGFEPSLLGAVRIGHLLGLDVYGWAGSTAGRFPPSGLSGGVLAGF